MNPRTRARWEVVAAAVLWSLSGFFSKSLTETTALHLDRPRLDPFQIAFYRAVFAGLSLAPTLVGIRFQPRRLVFVLMAFFAALNILFITAMKTGTAANAILLQYTAPLWVLVASYFLFHEAIDRRDLLLLAGGLAGIGVILIGNWAGGNVVAIATALGSGVAYAGVLICLRLLRDLPSNWLTVLNLLGAAFVLVPVIVGTGLPRPAQLVWLAMFGSIQLALPYWLMTRALRHISPIEAGLITLLEPALNPIWAYLISPATELPSQWTLIGGAIILGALAIRYRQAVPAGTQSPNTSAME